VGINSWKEAAYLTVVVIDKLYIHFQYSLLSNQFYIYNECIEIDEILHEIVNCFIV